MHFTTSFASHEPSDTLKNYLKITLNEKTPCICIRNRKIRSISLQEYRESSEKTIDQFALFTKVIEALHLTKNLIYLNTLEIQQQSFSNSNSSDSLLPNQTVDIFDTHLNSIKPSVDERIAMKSKLILSAARESIFSLAKGNAVMEKFHKQALANALDCHMNLYHKPLSTSFRKISLNSENITFSNHIRIEQNKIVKDLSINAINVLMRFYLKTNSSSINELTSELETRDRDLINHNHLFECPLMSKLLEESVLRELTSQTLHLLGKDIARHLHLTVLSSTKPLFCYEKPLQQKSLKESKQYDLDVHNLTRFISTLLNQFSKNESLKDHILSKIKEEKNVEKCMESFSLVCENFVAMLRIEVENQEEAILSKKLHDLLLTISQKTYSIPSIYISQILRDLQMNSSVGEHGLKIEYKFTEKDITLVSSKTLMSKEMNSFKLVISNSMKCNINTPADWSSEIVINVIILGNNFKDDIHRKVVLPLEDLGFNVELT